MKDPIIKELDGIKGTIHRMIQMDESKAIRRQGVHYVARYKFYLTSIEEMISRQLTGVVKSKDLETLLNYIAVSRRSIKNSDFINEMDIEKLHDKAIENMDDIIYMTKCMINKGGK